MDDFTEKFDADHDIDDLISELKHDQQELQDATTNVPAVSTNNMDDFILKASEDLINKGLIAAEQMQQEVISTRDPDIAESYGNLLKSVTKAIDTVSKLQLQKMKHESAKEIKQMGIDSSEKIAGEQAVIEGNRPTNNNILITTREDFVKMIESVDIEEEQPETIDVLDDEIDN